MFSSNLSLTSSLDGSWWSTPRPVRFILRYNFRRHGGPQDRSGRVRKILHPHWDPIRGPSRPYQVISTALSHCLYKFYFCFIKLCDVLFHFSNIICFKSTGLFVSPWNLLENWLMPQLNEHSQDYIFQQKGSPAHYKGVRGYFNRNFPQSWIGRTGK